LEIEANTNFEAVSADCGVWIVNGTFYGYSMLHDLSFGEPATNRQECRELCQVKPGCNAVTYIGGDVQRYFL
jgi:hypothetical protein